MKIEVTAEDIRLGQEAIRNGLSTSAHCAVARAVSRIMGKSYRWGYTTGSPDKFDYDNNERIFAADKDSSEVKGFIYSHDSFQHVEPFEFDAVMFQDLISSQKESYYRNGKISD